MNNGEWLTTAQVAAELDVTDRTVRGWILSGELPAERHGGRWRTRRKWLRMFIDMRTREALTPST